MLKRTISGSVYVALIVGFFLLRNVDARFFQIFIAFLCAVGTFEVARAERKLTNNSNNETNPFAPTKSFISQVISKEIIGYTYAKTLAKISSLFFFFAIQAINAIINVKTHTPSIIGNANFNLKQYLIKQ